MNLACIGIRNQLVNSDGIANYLKHFIPSVQFVLPPPVIRHYGYSQPNCQLCHYYHERILHFNLSPRTSLHVTAISNKKAQNNVSVNFTTPESYAAPVQSLLCNIFCSFVYHYKLTY